MISLIRPGTEIRSAKAYQSSSVGCLVTSPAHESSEYTSSSDSSVGVEIITGQPARTGNTPSKINRRHFWGGSVLRVLLRFERIRRESFLASNAVSWEYCRHLLGT